MTITQILRKRSLHQKTTLKKRQLSSKTLIKRRKFFYINRIFFLSHKVFLRYMHLYLQGKSNEFDKEPLKNRDFTQYRALDYHKNNGGKINPTFVPQIYITYNVARGESPTLEREEEVETPFVTASFY